MPAFIRIIRMLFTFYSIFGVDIAAAHDRAIDALGQEFRDQIAPIVQAHFRAMDSDHSGFIEKNELRNAFKVGELKSLPTDIDVADFDVDKEEKISEAELVEITMKTAEEEVNFKIAEGLALAFGLTGFEEEIDEVTLETFRMKLAEPGMVEYLQQVNIDPEHIDKFYYLLDADRSGSLNFFEVVSGCVKLRGPARAVDIALLAQDQKDINERLEKHIVLVEKMMMRFLTKQDQQLLIKSQCEIACRRRSSTSFSRNSLSLSTKPSSKTKYVL